MAKWYGRDVWIIAPTVDIEVKAMTLADEAMSRLTKEEQIAGRRGHLLVVIVGDENGPFDWSPAKRKLIDAAVEGGMELLYLPLASFDIHR